MIVVTPGAPVDLWPRVAFKSGSSSSTANETNTTTNQFDQRVAATDDAIVVSLRDGSEITLTDPGLIEAAGAALDSYERAFGSALSFASDENKRTQDLTREVLARSTSEQAQSLVSLLKWGAVIAIGVVAAVTIPKSVKG